MVNAKSPPSSASVPSVVNLSLGWLATVGVIAIAAIRALVMFSPQLYWSVDPRATPPDVPLVQFGPTGAVITDWLAVIVMILALLAARRLRLRIFSVVMIALWAIGVGFVLYHGHDDAAGLQLGGDWIGALALGIAAAHLARITPWRRTILAAAVAIILPLGGEAMYQVFVEHPMTVQDYQTHKARYLAEHGWAEGSPEQRKFEERLDQVEATARFGFSNVFGTVMATLSLLALGVAASLIRLTPRKGDGYVIAGAALLGIVTLAITFSKGAVGAFMIALCAAVGAALITRRWLPGRARAAWRSLAFVIVALGILAVIARGMMGPPKTAAGERSLLFRSQYWQAAVRMIEAHPVAGVGPARFQQHYLVTKSPLSPEEVSDPHNVLLAFIAMLGLGGVAWCGVIVMLLWAAGGLTPSPCQGEGWGEGLHQGKPDTSAKRYATPDASGDAPPMNKWIISAAIVAGVLACGSQYLVEWPRYWVDSAALWAFTSALFIGLTAWLGVRPVMDAALVRIGLFAAAVALLLHAQIEMSLTNNMSGPLLMMILGAAAGAGMATTYVAHDPGESRSPASPLCGWIIAAAGAAVVIALAVIWVAPIVRQQSLLADAAGQLRHKDRDTAIRLLGEVNTVGPFDVDVQLDRVRLLAEANRSDEAIKLLHDAEHRGQTPAQVYRTEALLTARMAQHQPGPVMHVAATAAAQAAAADPHGMSAHLLAGDMAWDAGDHDKAREFYRQTLTISDQRYLDPNAQLDADDRARITQRLAQSPTPPSP